MKKLRSLSVKNFIMTAAILLIGFLLTGVAFCAAIYGYTYRENRDNMLSALEQSARLVNAYGSQWDLDDVEVGMTISAAASLSRCDILLADDHGTVVACSDRGFKCRHLGGQIPTEVLDGVSGDKANMGVGKFGELYPGRRQYVAVRLGVSPVSGRAGYLIMSMDMRSFHTLWREYSQRFALVAAIVFVAAAALSFAASRRQTEPINEIAELSRRFGQGELSVRVSDTGRQDEIGQLQRSFNLMAASIQDTEQQNRELIGNVSHDLKTPITTIVGFSDGILDGTIPPEKEREYLRTISNEARRMQRMVQNILTMNRISTADHAEVLQGSFDICEVARVCLLSLEGRIEEKALDVEVTLPEEEITVRGDMDSVTRVMTNLMDNAVKFSRPGGRLALEIWKQNGKAYVSVENEGETIPPEELPLIFQRFHKGDKSRSLDAQGSGLGLYIVKAILDSHGEDIFVTSEKGVTRFVFTLTLR